MGQLYHKYFLLYTVILLLILNTEFVLIWITPWPDEEKTTFKMLKNSQFADIGELYRIFFALHSH